MAKAKDTYISYELEFLEKKAEELKAYVEANPFHKLTDRINYKQTKGGGVIPMVVASIEQQVTSLTRCLKDYADIIKVIGEMREKEEAKKIISKGDQDVSPFESGKI
jgi:hypothetical protein